MGSKTDKDWSASRITTSYATTARSREGIPFQGNALSSQPRLRFYGAQN